MKRLLLCLALSGCAASPAARHRPWTVSLGWQETRLGGNPFEASGGHTVVLRGSRDVARWSAGTIDIRLQPEGAARVWGLEYGGRWVGFEIDAGGRFRVRPNGWPVEASLYATYGFSRAPLMTAIGPMRFLAARPAFGLGLSYEYDWIGARIDVETRCYSSIVWDGCTVAPGISGLFSW